MATPSSPVWHWNLRINRSGGGEQPWSLLEPFGEIWARGGGSGCRRSVKLGSRRHHSLVLGLIRLCALSL